VINSIVSVFIFLFVDFLLDVNDVAFISANGYVLAMVGHLKNISPTFAQMHK
jgi:hypothetical protein